MPGPHKHMASQTPWRPALALPNAQRERIRVIEKVGKFPKPHSWYRLEPWSVLRGEVASPRPGERLRWT